jgi:SAM-dependent methyltransferase
MKDFWNERYSQDDYAYGEQANDFLRSIPLGAGKKVLCLAEGEGRNAIYLAAMGNQVTAVDFSEQAILKVQRLAQKNGVEIETICADLNDFQFEANTWDVIIAIFAHFPVDLRKKVHESIYPSLKDEGVFILEAYHVSQLEQGTGGPTSKHLLYEVSVLQADFQDFGDLEIVQLQREISEGKFHKGISSVIQLIARK